MRHPLRWVACGVAVVTTALGVVLAVQVEGGEPSFDGGPLLGQPAPAFDLPTLDGDRVRLVDLAGKTVIVNFWNSWCIPCREEHAALVEFHRRHADDPDLEMIGIVRDDTEAAARQWVEERGVGWTVALDPASQAALDFGTTGQPETYAIGPDGVVVGVQLSVVSARNLEAMVARARGSG